MKQTFWLFLAVILTFVTPSMGRDYWQNEVAYTIEVTLLDSIHQLIGSETIIFKNNSPDELDHLEMLLYPNAYKDISTTFGREMVANHYKRFFFSTEKDRGWIEIDTLLINGEPGEFSYFDNDIDLAKIPLKKPLKPGESLELKINFRVKFPKSFSRMMHSAEHYEATQWYPKLAVYDYRGWAAYPYRDKGEFYGEYGVFDVSITLPENYIVAATGILQTESEITWLDSLAKIGNELFALDKKPRKRAFKKLAKKDYESGDTLKTIRFWQDNIHDFAWFADKKFIVRKGEAELPFSSRKVEVWTYALPKNYKAWQKSVEYVREAVEYYSLCYGEYPYHAVSAVDGAFDLSGGMEYPMISVNTSFNNQDIMESILSHETGHNWFQGILGSDERKHAWMDEGINSFSDNRYIETRYSEDYVTFMPKKLKWMTKNLTDHNMDLFMALSFARRGQNMPNNLPADEYQDLFGYMAGAYTKTAIGFKYLQDYLGDEKFDALMKEYYEKWKFKHPMPEDFIAIAEKHAGESLDWFFDDFMGSGKVVDYELDDVKVRKSVDGYEVSFTVENEGELSISYYVEIYRDDDVLKSYWRKPVNVEETFTFHLNEKPNRIIIDPHACTLDINSHNNVWPLKVVIQPGFDIENPHVYQLFFSPFPYYNAADGFTLSGNLFRYNLVQQNHNFLVSGGYGFKSQNPIFRFIYDNHNYARGGAVKYGYRLTAQDNYGHRQYTLKLDHKVMPSYNDLFYFRRATISVDYIDFYESGLYETDSWSAGKHTDIRFNYRLWKRWYLDIIDAEATVIKGFDIGDSEYDFSRFDLSVSYKRRLGLDTRLSFRGYAGWILQDDKVPLQQYFWSNGGLDPYFEDVFMFDRSGNTFLSPFKHWIKRNGPLIRGYTDWTGDDYAVTFNAEFTTGVLGLFADGGSLVNKGEDFDLKYSLGLFLKFELIEAYFPLYLSNPSGYKGKWVDAHNFKQRYFISMTIPVFKIGP